MKKLILILLLVGCGAAFLTKPTADKHIESIVAQIEKTVSAEKNDGLLGAVKGAVFGLAKGLVTPLVKNAIEVEDYYLFSLSKVNTQEGKKTIGVGVFGTVFVSEKTIQLLTKESF